MQTASADKVIRILTVDDHHALRDGIAAVVGAESDMVIAGEASNGTEAIEAFERLRPDITLMDLQMPGLSGVDSITAIREGNPNARIIVLTAFHGDVPATRALKAGACAYLLKTSFRSDLIDTIRTVHAGRRQIAPEIAQEIALHAGDQPLTRREMEILKLVASGQANKEIAWTLSVSEDTVKGNMKSIFGKLRVNDRAHAVATAFRRGALHL